MRDEALPLAEQEVPVVREGVDFHGVFQDPDERALAHVFGQPPGAAHRRRGVTRHRFLLDEPANEVEHLCLMGLEISLKCSAVLCHQHSFSRAARPAPA